MEPNTIKSIMLIDDNKSDNFFHERAIRKYNTDIEIITYDSAELALNHLRENQNIPDIIFLDINMPGMTGWEFLEEYYSTVNENKRSIVITLLSTSESLDEILRAEKLGVYFKSKPLTFDILQETESNFIKQKRSLTC